MSDTDVEKRLRIGDVNDERRARLSTGILLTVCTWFLSRVIVALNWNAARNPFSFSTAQWNHQDSRNYLAIAAHGPTFGRCGAPGFRDG